MNIEKFFKNLILLDLAIFIISMVSLFFIPEEIEYISDTLDYGLLSNINEMYILATFAIIVIAYLINLILLYRFIRFGKNLYLFIFIIIIILSLLTGPVIQTSFEYTMNYLSGTVGGAILILLYFSPIKDKF